MDYQKLSDIVKSKKPGDFRVITRRKIIPTLPGVTKRVERLETYQVMVGEWASTL